MLNCKLNFNLNLNSFFIQISFCLESCFFCRRSTIVIDLNVYSTYIVDEARILKDYFVNLYLFGVSGILFDQHDDMLDMMYTTNFVKV